MSSCYSRCDESFSTFRCFFGLTTVPFHSPSCSYFARHLFYSVIPHSESSTTAAGSKTYKSAVLDHLSHQLAPALGKREMLPLSDSVRHQELKVAEVRSNTEAIQAGPPSDTLMPVITTESFQTCMPGDEEPEDVGTSLVPHHHPSWRFSQG